MCMIKEVWQDIPNYEGLYQISNYGYVRSFDRVTNCKNNSKQKRKGKILKFGVNGGYLHVNLWKNKKGISKKIHQLLAITFKLPNPNNYTDINHITENKDFNHIGVVDNEIVYSSIEWCDSKYNNNFGSRLEKLKYPKSEEHKKKLSEAHKGKKHSEETKQKLSEIFSIPIIQSDIHYNFIREWKSATQASKELNIDSSSIIKVCRGRKKNQVDILGDTNNNLFLFI